MAKARIHALTHDELLAHIHYDPETGIFTRLRSKTQKHRIGDRADRDCGDGYYRVGIMRWSTSAHQLAWFYIHGWWPEMVDHIDGNPSNNRISNLRESTNSENQQNQKKAHRRSSSKLLGAHRHDHPYTRQKWRSSIQVDGKKVFLGYFDTAEAAHAAYLEAKVKYHPAYVQPPMA
jgi:hypothetical protein